MVKPEPETLWLVGPLFLALLPQVLFLPIWVSVTVGLIMLWRLSPAWRKDSAFQHRLRLILLLAVIVAVFLEHHTVFGPEGGVSLLVLMSTLKLLESQGRRDHLVMTLAGYFLLMTVFIHDQRLLTALWLAFAAIVLTASLVATQSSTVLPLRSALKLGGSLILQALPLAILLFVLFPRLHSPIGGLIQTQQAKTGLSDSMSPGSVSQLIRSDAIAFRADFASNRIDSRELYWRGPVLTRYDGHVWRRADTGEEPATTEKIGRPLNYTVTLEASNQPWLPIAGLATLLSWPDAHETPDLEWLAPGPIQDRQRYNVEAWLDYRLETTFSAARRARTLFLPEGFNPKSIALGRSWAKAGKPPETIINSALSYFREHPFYYTLNPPLSGANAVDDFLFGSQRGFCEHYAGAFTVLMRAAGIPARVVTGYQGGEYNPIGNYWIIRQRDAHAWAEVWLPERGWVRVDPTAAVAPNRIELGIEAGLPAMDRAILNLPVRWLKPFRQSLDYINNGWNQWILGYDFERQQRFLNALSPSMATLRGMLWALLTGAAILIGTLSLLLLRPGRSPGRDEVSRLYARFLNCFAKSGLLKGQTEGPTDFARRAIRHRPDLTNDIEVITGLYTGLRYGNAPREWVGILKHRIRQFRL
jgi:transglutaminase-like putative cysteine protease